MTNLGSLGDEVRDVLRDPRSIDVQIPEGATELATKNLVNGDSRLCEPRLQIFIGRGSLRNAGVEELANLFESDQQKFGVTGELTKDGASTDPGFVGNLIDGRVKPPLGHRNHCALHNSRPSVTA